MNDNIEIIDNITPGNNSNMTSNVVVDPNEQQPKKSKKKLIKRIIYIFLIVLILAGVGLYFYKENVLLEKKKVIRNSIAEIFNVVNNKVDDFNSNIFSFDANEEPIGIDGTIKLSSNYKDDTLDLTKLQDYSLRFNNAFDLKNNKLSNSLSINKNGFSIFTLNNYINGKYGTVESGQLSYYAYSYNINNEIKDIKLNNKYNKDSLKNLVNRTREIILSKVSDKDITKDSYEDTINGKKSTFTRFTYKVDINNLVNEVLKNYIQDTSILNTISEITSQDPEIIKQSLQRVIDNNKGSNTISYEIYVDSLFGNFKQVKVYNIDNPNTYFRLYKVDNNYEYEIVNSDNKVYGKYSNNKIDLNSDMVKVEYEKLNKNEYKYTIKLDYDNEFIVLDMNLKNTVEGDKQSILANAKISLGEKDKTDNLEFNIELELNISKNATVKPITAFITKDISTIDENEFDSIKQRFENIAQNIVNDIYTKKNNIVNNNMNQIPSL